MATTSFGYTDSVTQTKSLPIKDLSYGKDFAVKRNQPEEVILTNTTSPVDQPETIRFGYQQIADIYKNTGIDPSYMSVTRRGISLVCQVNDVLRVTPDDPSVGVYDLPISAHVVIKTAVNQNVTADLVMQVALRAVSSMFSTGSITSERLNAMLRDSLVPSEM